MKDCANSDADLSVMSGKSITILTFQTNGQVYGLPVTAVRQIIEMVAIDEIPQAPPAIKGVINVRGQIVPVIDLRLRFSLPFLPYHLRTPIILLEVNGRTLGLVVDEVDTVMEVNPVDVQTTDKIFASSAEESLSQTGCFSSIAKVNNQIVMIIDAECLFSNLQGTKLEQLLAHQPIEPNTEAAHETELTGA